MTIENERGTFVRLQKHINSTPPLGGHGGLLFEHYNKYWFQDLLKNQFSKISGIVGQHVVTNRLCN